MSYNINNNQTVLAEDITTQEAMNNIKEKRYVYRFVKRIVDIIGGIIGCIILVPLTLVLYIVKLCSKDNKGPLFYEQLRVGKNGKQFRFYKYRSMVMNADEKLWEYLNNNPEAKEEYQKYKKLKDDPRVTKLGNILRKTSIDEFPQFINVLRGDMSLVGPRPYLYREKQDIGNKFDKIVSVKPGLTGLWQVNGRSETDFEERTNIDIYYVDNRSLLLDFKILIKTFLKVFKKEGAK